MTAKTFAAILSVYHREDPQFLKLSLASLVNQTRIPDKIILVKDGPLSTKLQAVIDTFVNAHGKLFHVVGYDQNKGLGFALNYGMQFAESHYVARMDADDIAVVTRFEEQMKFLEEHPDIDIVGSNIAEFMSDPANTTRIREVPEWHADIKLRARLTNPMNHMTVIFKKESVVCLGGYSLSQYYFEDYDLWVRMLSAGMRFHNLQRNLVLARIGNDMVGKRHGLKYVKHEFKYFKKMYASNFISTFEFFRALVLRIPLRLLPKSLLIAFYNFVLRQKH